MRATLQVATTVLLLATPTWAACPTFHLLENEHTAYANEVMDNFNYILNCPNFTGDVGIGRAVPLYKLDINANGYAGMRVTTFSDPGYSSAFIADNSDGTAYMAFAAIGSSYGKMQVTNAAGYGGLPLALNPLGGNVGIGITTPSYLLHVNGTGYATSWQQSSDRRLKTEIKPITFDALAKVMALTPVTFRWKVSKDDGMHGIQMGLVAQDVEKILPTVVLTAHDASKTKGLKYNELTAVLIKAVQEQQAMIKKLTVSIHSLNKKNTDLEMRLKHVEQNQVASMY